MKEKAISLYRHPFFNAGIWVFIGTGFLNIGNYLYHLLMARMLGPSSYGVLESAISLFYIFSIPLTTITYVIIKFVSTYKGQGNTEEISKLYHYFHRKILIFGTLFALILIIFSSLVVSFLHLSSVKIVVVLAIVFFIALFTMLNRSVLQGITNFSGFAITNFFEAVGKIFFAVSLVLLGFKAEGALFGMGISGIIGYLVAKTYIKKIKLKEKGSIEKRKVFLFALPVFFSMLGLTSLYTTDVILVRHFFPGNESGYYAAVSVLGKVIFFAVAPISIAMFPLVAENHAKGAKYTHYLLISVLLTILGASFIVLLYFLFPTQVIYLLFGKEFITAAPLVGLFGVFLGIYSLCYLLSNFYLSIHKAKAVYFVVIAGILQIILIFMFHQSLIQVIEVSIVISLFLLGSLFLYYPYATRR